MKLKRIYLALYALFICAPIINNACPTCVGRVQENSNTTFFHEDESANVDETQNEGDAS